MEQETIFEVSVRCANRASVQLLFLRRPIRDDVAAVLRRIADEELATSDNETEDEWDREEASNRCAEYGMCAELVDLAQFVSLPTGLHKVSRVGVCLGTVSVTEKEVWTR